MAKSPSSTPKPAPQPASADHGPEASASASAPALPDTYEAALRELEGLVAGLDSGQMPLEQLLGAYQRGAQLLAFCRGKLETVESQIKVLEGTELRPWTPN